MRSLGRAASLPVLLAAALLHAAAQEAPRSQGTAVITGRVSIGGKPAQGVAVSLYNLEAPYERGPLGRAATDPEGVYRLTGVPAGRFNVLAVAPAHVGPNENMFGGTGKSVTVAEGETVEKIDFALVRGGVITGRVRRDDGSPVIAERVRLNPVGEQPGALRGFLDGNPFMYETDDRGVYRLYGIAPGKYTVSVGESGGEGDVRFGFGGQGYYRRTYHPDASDAAQATVIEISEGTEVTNVDITVGRKSRSFVATGRVVDESGKPVTGAQIGHSALVNEGKGMGGMGWGSLSDAQGRFRLDGLLPGHYAVFIWAEGNAQGYSDPLKFEVTDGDVSGLELTLRRGASLSGVVVIEGTGDPAILARVSELAVGIGVKSDGLEIPTIGSIKVGADGRFHATGLRPGKAHVYMASYPPPPNIILSRVERDGIPQQEIEVTPNARITGVRVVFEYASGRIRGMVKAANGPLPEGARVNVSARRRGDAPGYGYIMGRGAEVDALGKFVIEGLPTGEYELFIVAQLTLPTPRQIPAPTRTVTVANGITSEITIALDLDAK